MDTTTTNLIAQATAYASSVIDYPYLIVFIGLAYAFKNKLSITLTRLINNERVKIDKTWTVFIIGSVVAVFFIFAFKHNPMNLLVNYAIGTSLHELFFKHLEKANKG